MANDEKNKLLRRFHAICAAKCITASEKMAMINSYGHISSKDFTVSELTAVIKKLDPPKDSRYQQADTWRKRVMAAIGGWLKNTGQESNAEKIKAIACRSTGHRDFNEIPIARLRNIYNEFRNKSTDAESVKRVKAEEIKRLENNN